MDDVRAGERLAEGRVRLRLWRRELQRLADETGLEIAVRHLPPGTGGRDRIEHRPSSAITQDRRGRPLVSHETVVDPIAAATTRTGPRVRSGLDENDRPAGLRVSDGEMATLRLRVDPFHGDRDHSLLPRQRLPLADAVVS